MKRSEMHIRLTTLIALHTKAMIWTDAGLAEDVLKMIEMSGMLPPRRVLSEPKWVDGDGGRHLQGRIWHRSWELEGEESNGR
jgi:hypothetical protein